MNIDQFEDLEAVVLQLPTHARARLAESLLSSLDEETEVEAAWDEEADRRWKSFLAGETTSRPADEVIREIMDELDR